MKIVKWLGILLGMVALVAGGGLIYFVNQFPETIAVPDMKISATQDQIDRGNYLANHVAVCTDCHSIRDWNFHAGPIREETLGGGGELFPAAMGLPGDLISPNLTPSPIGIGNWSDGEVFRAITSGLSKDGSVLFPFMPYPNYGRADREDILAIIAYLRTLSPIENPVPRSSLNFPMNLIVRSIPSAPQFQTRPDRSDSVAYGAYLANLASCSDCHTPAEKGKPLSGMDYAGGFAFSMPFGIVRSANITPDVETGIGSWSKEQFIGKFKSYEGEAARTIPSKPPYNEANMQTLMPWLMYAGMTREDLSSLYDYLRTLPPVKNKIIKFSNY